VTRIHGTAAIKGLFVDLLAAAHAQAPEQTTTRCTGIGEGGFLHGC
jgi:hypothetical protein